MFATPSLVTSTPNSTLLSQTQSTSAQRATSVIPTMSVVTNSSSIVTSYHTTPTAAPTSKPVGAPPQTGRAHIVIAAEILGPIAIFAAAGLLLRYRQSRTQAKRKIQGPTPFTDGPRVNSSSEVPEMLAPPAGRSSRGRVSALLAEKVRDDLRRTRQDAIDQRLRTLRGEIVEISTTLAARGAMVPADETRPSADHQHTPRTGDDTVSSRRLRRMINTKRRQIERHEQQRQSPWALGLSEQSPLEDANMLS